MTIRGLVAVANSKLLSLSRSPIAPIVCGAFLLLVFCLPEIATTSRVERVRQASSWLVAAAGALLLISALLVPVGSRAQRVRQLEGRLAGVRRTNLGHGLAGLAFLVFLAGLLAMIAWGWISLEFPQAELGTTGAVARTVVWRNPDRVTLRPGVSWTSAEIVVPPQGGSLHVELTPQVRFGDAPESAPASKPARQEIEVSIRAGERVRTKRIPLAGTQTAVHATEFEWTATAATRIRIQLRALGTGVEAGFDRGGIAVLGVRSQLFAVVMRSLLVIACMAAVLLAATQWFSNFVAPLIAVSAALTLVIVALAVRGIAPDLLPGGVAAALLPGDPVAALRRGHETGWAEVGRAFAASCVAIVLSAVASVPGPERREP